MSRVWLLVAVVVASLAVANAQDAQCLQYCNVMLTNCTSVFGPRTPANSRWCINECEIIYKFRPGSSSADANTFACRWKYAQQVMESGNKANCPHAAPWSDKCVTATITGPSATIPVGPLCDSYCDKQAILCGGRITPYINPFFSAATYASPAPSATTTHLDALNQCLLECSLYPPSADSPVVNTTYADTKNCRYYHLTLIAKNNVTYPPQLHCPHSSPAGGSPGNMACIAKPPQPLPAGADFVWGSCLNYCDTIVANPTVCAGLAAGGGVAYPDYKSCLGACLSFNFVSNFTLTSPGFALNVASGDSFECRRHWMFQTIFDGTGTSGSGANNMFNCLVAGSFGGDVPKVGGSPVCGDACSFYCDEMNGNKFNGYKGHCTVAQGGFPDWNTCYSQCKTNLYIPSKRASLTQLTTQLTSSDTLECRSVFAGLAANVTMANTACAAASIASVPGTCAPLPKPSSTGGSKPVASSTGLSGASAVQASFSVLLVACFAAFFGSRRM